MVRERIIPYVRIPAEREYHPNGAYLYYDSRLPACSRVAIYALCLRTNTPTVKKVNTIRIPALDRVNHRSP
jgi:hypothetical protein